MSRSNDARLGRAGGRVAARAGVLATMLVSAGCSLMTGEPEAGPTAPPTGGPQTTQAAAAEQSTPPSPDASPSPSGGLNWAALYADTSGGVARVATVTCDGVENGSGFLVGPGLVATAAHVVGGASSISLRFGPDVYSGDVVLTADEDDLALIQVDGAPGAHQFSVAEQSAAVGEDVAVMGYPLGRPIAMTQGAVTSVDLRADVEGADRRGLFMTDSAINPGNSGGPVIDTAGQVAGVVIAGGDAPGAGLAVSVPAFRGLMDRWASGARDDVPAAACESSGEAEYGLPVEVTVSSDNPEAPSIAQAMQLYAESINSGYYDLVWQLLTASMREQMGNYEEYTAGLQSSYWLTLDVVDVQSVDDRSDEAVVAFRTVQDAEFGPDGQTCSDWLVTYTLALDEGYWQIDGARLDSGAPLACDQTLPSAPPGESQE